MDVITPHTPKSTLTDASVFRPGRTLEPHKGWQTMFDPHYTLPPGTDGRESTLIKYSSSHRKTKEPDAGSPKVGSISHRFNTFANEDDVLPCPDPTTPTLDHGPCLIIDPMAVTTKHRPPSPSKHHVPPTFHQQQKLMMLLPPTTMYPRLHGKSKARYYFYFGFMFPPLWLLATLQNKDMVAKKRSRTAFFVFMILSLILVLVLQPALIGLRHSAWAGPNASSQQPAA